MLPVAQEVVILWILFLKLDQIEPNVVVSHIAQEVEVVLLKVVDDREVSIHPIQFIQVRFLL